MSRWQAIVAAVLALFAGPMLLMYPTIDNFAVFGATGAGSLYCSMRAIRAERPGPWLVVGGALAAGATLARIDGALLTVAVATAWFVRRGWTPWRPERTGGASLAWGVASAGAFLLVMAPWLARNLAVFGACCRPPAATRCGSRATTSSSSIGHEVSLATYLDWGIVNIIGSKLVAWGELVGRTAVLLGGIFVVFFLAGVWIFRRRAELAPFLVYFAVMFFVMGARLHLPRAEGRLLPLGSRLAAMGVRDRRGCRRAGLHRGRSLLAVPPPAADASVHRRGRCGGGDRALGRRLGPDLP